MILFLQKRKLGSREGESLWAAAGGRGRASLTACTCTQWVPGAPALLSTAPGPGREHSEQAPE